LTCFFSKFVSPSSLKASRNFFYHLQPLPSLIIKTNLKWDDYLLFFFQEAVSQLDAILDATYTDAKDISKHEASG